MPSGVVAPPQQIVAGAIVRFNNAAAVVDGSALISPGFLQTHIVVPQLGMSAPVFGPMPIQ